MGIFDRGKQIKALQSQVNLLQQRNSLQQLAQLASNINRTIAVYPNWDISSFADRYCTDDNVYSLIRLLASASASIPFDLYEVTKGKDGERMLEELDETDPVVALLDSPCTDRGKMEFYEALYSFLYLAGETFIYKQRPTDGPNKGVVIKLQNWFPQNVTMNISETLPRRIVSYDYTINGQKVYENVPAEDVIHIKYFNPSMDSIGGELRGLSPIKVLNDRLTRMDAEMDVSVAQLQNGGVETIVFDKAVMDQKALEIAGQRKDNFHRFISNTANAGAPFFATGEMGAIQLGSTLADMGVMALSDSDKKSLCNAYNVSARLLNFDGAGSEVSDKGARKGLYNNAVKPNVQRVQDALKSGLLNEFEKGRVFIEVVDGKQEVVRVKGDGKKRDIEPDYSDVKELQEDIKDMVTWLKDAWWLTGNEKRAMMTYDKVENPLYDEPLLPTGVMTADDMNPVDPVDDDL